jgi:hypothetical protein
MKSFRTLVKLHKKKLDEIGKEISLTEKKRDNYKNTLRSVTAEFEDELKNYFDGPFAFMMQNYKEKFFQIKKNLENNIEEMETKISILQNDLAQHFGELKKFEILLEKSIQAQKQKNDKLELEALDEFNVINITRKN